MVNEELSRAIIASA